MSKLRHLEIRNFRSLKEASLNFHPRVTVLVGKNNSGKSNVMDALSFLQSLVIGDPNDAISRRGGFRNVVFGFNEELAIGFSLEFESLLHADFVKRLVAAGVPTETEAKLDASMVWIARYNLDFRPNTFQESIELTWDGRTFPIATGGSLTTNHYPLLAADFPAEISHFLETGDFARKPLSGGSSTSGFTPGFRLLPAPNRYTEMFIKDFQRIVSNLVTRVGPNRNPSHTSPIGGANVLKDDGSNLADWVDSLRSNRFKKFLEFAAEFQRLVPEATELSTPRLGGPSTTVAVSEDWNANSGFDLASLSYGERNLLVLVGFLVDDKPSTTLTIEEPENSIHPSAQRVLAASLWRYSDSRQILASTHSLTFLARFPLEAIRVVTRGAGKTDIAPLSLDLVPTLIRELGSMPSDHLDLDVIVFVEGDTDEAVFSEWARTMLKADELSTISALRCGFISVRGLTNIPFYLDARILQARSVKPEIFVITDGDVNKPSEVQDQWRMVRSQLVLPPSHLLTLETGKTIEDYLLVAPAIYRAYQDQFKSIGETETLLRVHSVQKKSAKSVLSDVLDSLGMRLNTATAIKIARSMELEEMDSTIRLILETILSDVE